ncbi:biotin--[acetyl-CoA-carboxylase] ligase [Agromyces sp. MMS24-K17]|uniref:biotin--[acetyl-CoA-carboxylase] ligase n=1 Tax=Agromyces sp. MMS24-K17 TaxID=3372850 RepID=UPI003754BA01
MDWSRSRAAVPRFEFLAHAGSTNDVLRDAATGSEAADWPHGAIVVTDDQTAGRGRLGRTWFAPSGKTLAISLLVRPAGAGGRMLPPDALGWIPLIAGAAMTEAARRAVAAATEAGAAVEEAPAPAGTTSGDDGPGGVEVELKWPNDVLVSGYKLCGILTELAPGGDAIIVGAGLNLTLDEHDLPAITATSLLLATGREPDADAVLADYLSGFLAAYATFAEAGGDAERSGTADWVRGLCGTLDADVRVELPGGGELVGTAEAIDGDGRLVVREHETGEPQAVSAGDVTHLRY